MMDITSCPECDAVAEVRGRDVLSSTDGPVEHVRVLCVNRHWFLMPADRLPPIATGGTRSTGLRADPAHSTWG